jgi:DNA polymerase-3 subunit gamma/tau
MLTLKYRPQTFRELAGQGAAAGTLFRMIHEREGPGQPWRPRKVPRVPAALLFTGTRGAGKTSTARILAKALNCEAERERPCDCCASCAAIREGTSLAVVEIDAASNGTVDQVRKLQELVSYDVAAAYRVVILDEVHSMSSAGFDMLLKVLEEPPERTVFILLTTEYGRIKATITSRCMYFPFRAVAPQQIVTRLVHICQREELAPVDPALLALLAERADGSLRDAVMALDQAARAGALALAEFEQLHGETDFAPWLISYMVLGDYPGLFAKVDQALAEIGDFRLISARLVSCLRDVLVLLAGGQVTAQARGLRYREQIAARTTAEKVVGALKVLWELQTKMRTSDPRSALELAMVMCTRVLGPAAAQRPVAATGSSNGEPPGIAAYAALVSPS